jgi:riboflavin synthase
MSEGFSGQACRGRIRTELGCDCIVVLGSTGTPNELNYLQTCVDESFNRVLMGGVATRESEESGTMGYE